MKCCNSIKNTDEVYSKIKEAYKNANVPEPYPAANKQLQARLHQFVSNGLKDDEEPVNFGKLVMNVKEQDQTEKKLIVLLVDDEINLILNSFIQIYEETGFIESAPKCHKRLRDTYAISDGRIRLVQRVLASYIASGASASTENTTKDEGGEKISPIQVTHPKPNQLNKPDEPGDENSPPSLSASGVTTRSQSTSKAKCKILRERVNNKKEAPKKRKY